MLKGSFGLCTPGRSTNLRKGRRSIGVGLLDGAALFICSSQGKAKCDFCQMDLAFLMNSWKRVTTET